MGLGRRQVKKQVAQEDGEAPEIRAFCATGTSFLNKCVFFSHDGVSTLSSTREEMENNGVF